MATSAKAAQAEKGRDFFRRVVKEGAFAPVFLLSGDERFLVDEAILRLVQSVFPSGRDDFNFVVFQGSESKAMEIVNAAECVPMFASRRVVVVRGLEKMPAAEQDSIATYCERPFASTLLVLEAGKLDARLKATKRLNDASFAVDFSELTERDVVQWVARRARARGLILAADVPDYLVDAIGSSLLSLDLAIERIDLFAGGQAGTERQITLAMVAEIVSDTRARNVFELTDFLASRDLGASISCFRRMLEQGENAVGSVAMIARQFRQLLLVKDGTRRGMDDRELASFVGCPPFKVRDYQNTARAFRDDELATLIGEIMRTDHALKSSRLPKELKVEQLFARICLGAVQ